uniref:Pro-corazonin n=1 Tax=Anopheles melas TaxID=34690 RepID=A0A182TG41_9DIPT
MLHTRTIALLLVGLVVLVNAQTFQYSRGWTNGKRSPSSSSSSSPSSSAAMDPLTANQLLASVLSPGGLNSLKPSEKTLLRRFLRNPCDLRVANLLVAAHPTKELFPLAGNSFDSAESAGAAFVLPPFLMDPDESNGGIGGSNLANGRSMEDELRFKRGTATGFSDHRQKIA